MPRSEMLRVNLHAMMALWPFWDIGPGLRPQGGGCESEDCNGGDTGDAGDEDQRLRGPTGLSPASTIVVVTGFGKDDDNDDDDADAGGADPQLTGPAVLGAVSVCRRRLYRCRCC